MEQSDLLRHVVEVMNRLGIPYFVTGSWASLSYGEPRFTHDIDVVTRMSSDKIAPFCESFPPDNWYVSPEAVRDAISRRSQFNILHPTTGYKIDVMIAKETPFDVSRFARVRTLRPREDFEAVFAAPEDVIVKKMEFYKEGGSEKHLRDIMSVLKISGTQIDRAYISEWAQRLDVLDVWNAILKREEDKP